MIESIAARRIRVVANNHQTFGVCWHAINRKRWALIAAELGVDFWYLSVFGEG